MRVILIIIAEVTMKTNRSGGLFLISAGLQLGRVVNKYRKPSCSRDGLPIGPRKRGYEKKTAQDP